jgi:hypothetical protein
VALKLEDKFKKMFGCDSVRISKPTDRLFLIIGYKKHTKDDTSSAWYKDGERIDFEYIAEQVIASGDSEEELIKSAKHYKNLLGFNKVYKRQDGTFDWEEYLKKYDFDGNKVKA